MVTRAMDGEKKDQFDTELASPLAGQIETPTPFEVEREGEDFMAFYAQVNGGQV